jgi:catechol 2,3-dioxygenase-like lactoylglutathione lyase family enzyme
MLQLKALDHLGLKVKDLEKTLSFYQQLGLKVLRTKGPDAAGVRMAVLQVGNQELNVACHPDFTPPGKDNAVGVDHFCFEVEAASMDEVVADLKRAGIEIAGGPTARRDGAALFLVDPDGVRVELQLKRPTTPGSGTGER